MAENSEINPQPFPVEETIEDNPFVSETDKAFAKKNPKEEFKNPEIVVVKGKSIMDYYFYLFQRGEVGYLPEKKHPKGFYPRWYKDSGGNNTIGIGSVGGGKNAIRSPIEKKAKSSGKITRDEAIAWSRDEMYAILHKKCLEKFPNFDKMLPCYQAIIMDTCYQGNVFEHLLPLNEGDAVSAREKLAAMNANKERKAIRDRIMSMGIEIERYRKEYPNAQPREIATIIANDFIEKDKLEKEPDAKLTRDELAMLYHSCNAAYGIPSNDLDVEAFALSFKDVKSGFFGIGSGWQPEHYLNYSDKPNIESKSATKISQEQEQVFAKPMSLTLNDKTADLDWLFNYSVERRDVVNQTESLALKTTLIKSPKDDLAIDSASEETSYSQITLKHEFLDHSDSNNLRQYQDKPTLQESEAMTIAEHLKASGTDITESVTSAKALTNETDKREPALSSVANQGSTSTDKTQPTTITQPSIVGSEPLKMSTSGSVSDTIKVSAETSVDCVQPSEVEKLPTKANKPVDPKTGAKSRRGR